MFSMKRWLTASSTCQKHRPRWCEVAKSHITSSKSVKINSSRYIMYFAPHLGFQELGLLLYSLILNPELYYSKEMPLPALFFPLLLVLCTFCSRFNWVSPTRVPLPRHGLNILIVSEASRKRAFAAMTVFTWHLSCPWRSTIRPSEVVLY